jgi:hypothetical protein
MKRFSEQFKNKADSIHLNTAEKRELRERVVSYMEYHPLPASTKLGVASPYVRGEVFRLVPVNTWKFLKLSGSLVLVLVLSISYLAEKAVPGDALYAVKISVNEEVRSSLARGSYEKVVWETERLNRRIAEARLLANEGRLTEEVEEQMADAVREHSENARKEIENLKLTDKDEAAMASIELTTALGVQTTSLQNRDAAEEEGQPTTLLETVLIESQAAEESAVEDTLPAYDRLVAKVESETTRAHELLEGVKKSATLEEQTDIRRRLDDIERKIEAAMQISATEDVASREGMVEVLQQTHRLIVFMTNIDVRSSVTVDEIVPVTLTLEERTTIVQKQMSDTKILLSRMENALNSTSTEAASEVIEKVELALDQSSTSLEQALVIMNSATVELEAAEVFALDAYNLAFDGARLLGVSTDIGEEEVEEITPEVIEVEVPVEEIVPEATTTEATPEVTEVLEV